MAKQFIRHLEYYGFPDQNNYSSDLGNVDLSDIIKKNKEQDEEIEELEGEKADKTDLDALSGTVESLIAAQTEINQNVAESISGITADIEKQKVVDDEFAAQLSALTEGVDNINETVSTLDETVGEISEALSGLTDELNDFEANVEETYAKKEDTYTKQEVDDLIAGGVSGYATEEWVLAQNYLNQETGDGRYAKKETVDALSDRLNNSVLDLQTKIYTVSGSLDTYKVNNDARMGTLETNFATLDGKVNREIDQISGDVASFDNRIRKNTTDIADLAEVVNRKANKSDLDNLTSTVTTLSNALDGKVNTTEYNTYKSRIAQQFNDMDNVKADKSSVVAAMNEIAAVDNKVTQEETRRIAADALLQGLIDNIEDEIVEIKEGDVHEDERITALEDGLAQEIADRAQGDLNLIGATSDTKAYDTIWGAKRFAQDQKGIAISEAATYTNEQIAGIRNEFEGDFNDIERELTAKADTTYVDASRNELRQTLEEEFQTALEAESTRAQVQETQLNAKVNLNTSDIQENDTKITNLTTKVKCITEWEGNDPAQYDDSGNGILDVLHREFHDYVEKDGIIESIEYDEETGDLIIIYKTTEGRKETRIHVGDIVDLTNYYTKEEIDANHYTKIETDNKLSNKADSSALTEVIESLDYNTEAIESLSGKVNTLSNSVTNLNTTVSALQNSVNNNTASINSINNQISTLTDAINNEKERAIEAENNLNNSINVEKERAMGVENTINTRIDNLVLECGIY